MVMKVDCRPPAVDPAAALRAARVKIYIAGLLLDASTYSFSMVMSCHAKEALRADYWDLGKLGALCALLYSITCLLTGGASDRLGSIPLVFGALATISLTFIGTMYVQTFNQLMVAGAFMGASLAFFWPPLMRQLSILSPGKCLWGALGKFNVFWAIGVGLGTLSTPLLYASLGLAPTLAAGLAVTALAVPCFLGRSPAPPPESDAAEGRPEASPERQRLFLRLAWISNFTAFFAMVGLMRVFPKVSGDLGIAIGNIGWVLLPLDLGKIGAFLVLARLPFWHYSWRWLSLTQVTAGAALIAAGLLQAKWLFVILFFPVGALTGLTYFSSIYYGLNLREGEGKKSGLHETILSSGVCLGPLLCGLIGERFNTHPGAALIFGGAVVLLGLGLQTWIYARAPRVEQAIDLDLLPVAPDPGPKLAGESSGR